MKKFIVCAFVTLATVLSVSAFAATPVADASVVCGPGDSKTAKAVGENARVTASCGARAKPAATVRKQSSGGSRTSTSHQRASFSGGSSSALMASLEATTSSRFPDEGRVYSDAGGNTFERHYGGSRECKFYINGDLVKRQFVQHPDPVQSKRQCDLLSMEFYATVTPTTPEKGNLASRVSEETSYNFSHPAKK